MERKTSRNLYLVGLVLAIIATVLLIVGGGVAAGATNSDGSVSPAAGTSLGIMLIVAFLVYIVAAVFALIAWIGALIKTAKLGQWVWFILLLVINVTMLVYIFAGPTEPKVASA